MQNTFWLKCFFYLQRAKLIKLDMASHSVDDQYTWCQKEMEKWMKQNSLQKESESNKNYANVWNEVKRKFRKSSLSVQIIKMYTAKDFHNDFNVAMSSGKVNYRKDFPYKTFHYLLTRAVQKFKLNNCKIVYRRSNISFVTDVEDKQMRFGRFASTSLNKDITKFGNKSCFEIHTCFGADINMLSEYPNENEVLIPPYEVFKITKVTRNVMDCDVFYTLMSTGQYSYMNCTLASLK